MKLPDAERAFVEERKITEYLLSFKSPNGRHKAAFFTRFGFMAEQWEVFAAALVDQGGAHSVKEVESNPPYGENYVVEGPIATPDGRNPVIATVWETTEDNPSP